MKATLDQRRIALAGPSRGWPQATALGVLLIGLWLPLAACQQPAREVPAGELVRAQETLQPFKAGLLGALMGALEAGPENAIAVCRERAPQIAAELSVGGIEIGRTSHRLRNPANAPRRWVEPLLAAYVEDPLGAEPAAVWVDDSTIGYVEPIRAVPLCISCHGPAVEPALLAEIRSLYPEDRATDFRTGDLRGLFWLTMPASGAGG